MARTDSHTYSRPSTLSEATQHLSVSDWDILAGGTDIYPAWAQRSSWGASPTRPILDITNINELGRIESLADGFRIGALASWSDLLAMDLPPCFDALNEAARVVGGPQIQNQATIVGNICNASPAADGVPPLLALGAEVDLASVRGRRRLPIEQFIKGSRRTACAPDELVTGLFIPQHALDSSSSFLKLGSRKYLVISIVSVAIVLELSSEKTISNARIAVGACSEVPQRLPSLEASLLGRPISEDLSALLSESDLAHLSPIDDIRADSEYRIHAAYILTKRAMGKACEGFQAR